jgi:hypothetical protein
LTNFGFGSTRQTVTQICQKSFSKVSSLRSSPRWACSGDLGDALGDLISASGEHHRRTFIYIRAFLIASRYADETQMNTDEHRQDETQREFFCEISGIMSITLSSHLEAHHTLCRSNHMASVLPVRRPCCALTSPLHVARESQLCAFSATLARIP